MTKPTYKDILKTMCWITLGIIVVIGCFAALVLGFKYYPTMSCIIGGTIVFFFIVWLIAYLWNEPGSIYDCID